MYAQFWISFFRTTNLMDPFNKIHHKPRARSNPLQSWEPRPDITGKFTVKKNMSFILLVTTNLASTTFRDPPTLQVFHALEKALTCSPYQVSHSRLNLNPPKLPPNPPTLHYLSLRNSG